MFHTCCPRCGYHDIEDTWTGYVCNDCGHTWDADDDPCTCTTLDEESN